MNNYSQTVSGKGERDGSSELYTRLDVIQNMYEYYRSLNIHLSPSEEVFPGTNTNPAYKQPVKQGNVSKLVHTTH